MTSGRALSSNRGRGTETRCAERKLRQTEACMQEASHATTVCVKGTAHDNVINSAVVRKNSTLASERVRHRWYGMIGGC
jgi:hypothetical protein